MQGSFTVFYTKIHFICVGFEKKLSQLLLISKDQRWELITRRSIQIQRLWNGSSHKNMSKGSFILVLLVHPLLQGIHQSNLCLFSLSRNFNDRRLSSCISCGIVPSCCPIAQRGVIQQIDALAVEVYNGHFVFSVLQLEALLLIGS